MFTLEEDGSGGSITGTSVASGSGQQVGARTSELSLSNNEAVKELRGTPPPLPGTLVPVVGQMNNSGVVLVPRTIPHQPLTILSSSPHSHCSNHLSGNGCGHVSFDCRHVACSFTKYISINACLITIPLHINIIKFVVV